MKNQISGYLDIVEARYVSAYKICLSFNDGSERIVDFGPFLSKAQNPDLAKYRNQKLFKNFYVLYGNLMWGDYEMVFPIADLHSGSI